MATKANTVTRASVLTKVLAEAEFLTAEEREVLQNMLASITKPRKPSTAPTKAQLENAELAEKLIAAMRAYGEPVTAKWVTERVEGIQTAQKAVAVVKSAGSAITRFYEGRQAYYRLS